MNKHAEQTDWQPVKVEDIVNLYRAGWTLRPSHCIWQINRNAVPGDLFPSTAFLHDNWEGKSPVKWKLKHKGSSFLSAINWLAVCPKNRRIRLPQWENRFIQADTLPHYTDSSDSVHFNQAQVNCCEWELWEEVAK